MITIIGWGKEWPSKIDIRAFGYNENCTAESSKLTNPSKLNTVELQKRIFLM